MNSLIIIIPRLLNPADVQDGLQKKRDKLNILPQVVSRLTRAWFPAKIMKIRLTSWQNSVLANQGCLRMTDRSWDMPLGMEPSSWLNIQQREKREKGRVLQVYQIKTRAGVCRHNYEYRIPGYKGQSRTEDPGVRLTMASPQTYIDCRKHCHIS